jgi:hypothetical protein
MAARGGNITLCFFVFPFVQEDRAISHSQPLPKTPITQRGGVRPGDSGYSRQDNGFRRRICKVCKEVAIMGYASV